MPAIWGGSLSLLISRRGLNHCWKVLGKCSGSDRYVSYSYILHSVSYVYTVGTTKYEYDYWNSFNYIHYLSFLLFNHIHNSFSRIISETFPTVHFRYTIYCTRINSNKKIWNFCHTLEENSLSIKYVNGMYYS